MSYRIIVAFIIVLFGMVLTPAPSMADGEFRFRAATLNIKADLSLADSIRDTRKAVAENPDAIAFQEIGGDTRAKFMRKNLSAEGYGFVRLDGPAKSVPIAFNNRRWDKVKSFSWYLSDRTFVRVPGPGPRWMREKEATVVILKQGPKTVAFTSAHLVPEPELNRERAELHALQIQRLVRLENHLQARYGVDEIVFAGDYNTEDRSLLQPLVDEGLELSAFVRTHRDGAIDHVLGTLNSGKTYAVNVRSDHHLLVSNLKG